jgi:hypothetical protein
MAKSKWGEETIIKRILMVEGLGEDMTSSHVKEIDSALVGAAISYFGNWGSALRAAGLDYEEIRKVSKQRRSEKVRKWSINKVIDEIRQVAEHEDDLSYAYMKEKHSSLAAAASNYIGSWKKALEMCGFDYGEVLSTGRTKRAEREKAWYCDLLLDRLKPLGDFDENSLKRAHPKFHKLLIEHFSDWRRVMRAFRERYPHL